MIQTWQQLIEQEKQQPYLQQTLDFVAQARAAGKVVYPPDQDVFNAFKVSVTKTTPNKPH